jgi:hypothetical protein
MKKGGRSRPSLVLLGDADGLLAGVLAAVLAPEPGSGLTNKTIARGITLVVPAIVVAVIIVGIGIAAERRGGDRAGRVDRGICGSERAAYDAGCNIARLEAGIALVAVPAVVVVAIGHVASRIVMAIGHMTMMRIHSHLFWRVIARGILCQDLLCKDRARQCR